MRLVPPVTQIISRYVRSIQYYRFKQLSYWVLYFLRRHFPKLFQPRIPQIWIEPKWKYLKHRVPFLRNPNVTVNEIWEGQFTVLNKTGELGSPINWYPKGVSRLWIYNLHYFDYLLPVLSSDPRRGWYLVADWIANNPPGSPDSWDPFPLSLRIANWIQALSEKLPSKDTTGPIIKSLYQQCLFLEKSLEWHLLANHLFKNAKALTLAGLFFRSNDADRWLKKGIEILTNEIDEQILADGGHFERSSMYHAMILKDCIDLLNVEDTCITDRSEGIKEIWMGLRQNLFRKIPGMMHFLSCMTHPDGKIALFNDAAFGIEPECEHLVSYAHAVVGGCLDNGIPQTTAFRNSGYFVMRPSDHEYLVIDCGPIGPDYQPGHAHCDTLSFELSIKGTRIIVDSGTYLYEEGDIRSYNRGNNGHNTLTIDGVNQSEVWGAHRCARRAKPIFASLIKSDDGSLIFEGAHDGYTRLSGRPIHLRKVLWERPGQITINDEVTGSGKHDIELRLHIHPSITVKSHDGGVSLNGEKGIILSVSPAHLGSISVHEGWYCPEFGKRIACKVLVLEHRRVQLPFKSGWILEW